MMSEHTTIPLWAVPKGSKTLPYAGLLDEELDHIIQWHCNDNSNTMITPATKDSVSMVTTAILLL